MRREFNKKSAQRRPRRPVAARRLRDSCIVGLRGIDPAVQNTHVSADVSAKGFGSYKEILFIPPKDDHRNVVPRAVSELQSLGFKVTVVDSAKGLWSASQGTGFLIGSDGYILTCAHVLGDKKEATITLDGARAHADVIKADEKADLRS